MSKVVKKMSILLIILLVLQIVGCKNTSSIETVEEDRPIQIGFAFDSFVIDRWLRDRDMFVYVAQQLGAVVDVQNANGDLGRQITQIEEFIRRRVDVIVVVAVDCYGKQDVINRARAEGIPVIAYDRLIQNAMVDLYITVDNELIGAEMAHAINQKLPFGGNVVMISGPSTDSNTRWVTRGFESALRNSKILAQVNVPSWEAEHGRDAIIELMNEFDTIDAIMCGNDALAGSVIQVLSERQLAGSIIVTGQDADIEACQRIVEGTQAMTVFKPIELMATRAAEFAVRLGSGEELTEVVDFFRSDVADVPYYGLEPISVTRFNIEQIIIESGFHLREDVFRNVRN